MATKIKIEATIASPVSKVWANWTEPKHITKWNFASPDWHCPTATNDLKQGGKFTSRMEAKDGSYGFDFEGTYDEVEHQKKISYSMSDGRKVITNFEQAGDSTKITTEFDVEDQNSAEMQKQGWQAILNNFRSYTEGN